MLRLRKLIARLLCVVPFIYGLVAISAPPFILGVLQETFDETYEYGEPTPLKTAMLWGARLLLIILAICPVAICISSAITALQLFRGKQSGRIWAIACGIALLTPSIPCFCVSLAVVHMSRSSSSANLGLLVFALIHLAAGILLLVAFLPRGSVKEPIFQNTRSARVKGDGTASFSLLVACIVGAGGCYLCDSLRHRWSVRANLPSGSGLVNGNLSWLGAFVLVVVFHELGHVAAGTIVGMRLLSFRIGPLQSALEEGKWRFVLSRSWQSAFGGGVSMIPRSPLIYSRWRAIGAAAGGVLANLLTGAVALLGMLTAKGAAYEPSWEFLGQVATFSLAFFLMNLVPAQEAATYSDGARIYQILTRSVLEDFRRIVAMLQATNVTPLRPKGYDIELIQKVAASYTPSFDHALLPLVTCDYYFDKGRIDDACRKLIEAEALCDTETTYWAERCGNIVLRAACLLGDRAMAEKWWQRSLTAKSWNPRKKDHFPACAYYTVTGRMTEAEEAWQSQFERANRLPDSGGRAFDLHYLARLREMLDEAARRKENAPPAEMGEQLDLA